MEWITGILLGIAFAWAIRRQAVMAAFEKGVVTGIGFWSAICLFTVPLTTIMVYLWQDML